MAIQSFIHEDWLPAREPRSGFNLALLKLPKPSGQKVPKLLYDHFKVVTGQKVMATGWGPGRSGPLLGDDIFGSLKIEAQEFISSQHCNRSSLWDGNILPDTICALNMDKQASCVGKHAGARLCRPFRGGAQTQSSFHGLCNVFIAVTQLCK